MVVTRKKTPDKDTMADKNQEKQGKIEILKLLNAMDIEETRCSIVGCSPNWAQKLACKKVYLGMYCVIGLFLGAYFTYTVSTISTIEKRFKLTSKQTGFMLTGNDISQVILSTFVAYFGNYGDRPKWVGIGVICAAIASFISATPHLIYGVGEDAQLVIDSINGSLRNSITASDSKLADFCLDPFQDNCAAAYQGSYTGPIVIFFMAQFFVGMTLSVFYTIGFAYLDDNVNKNDSPLYYAISMIIRVIGPVVGYFLGSQSLKLYVDPAYHPNLSLRDPRWLGAWWIGYFLLSGILFITGLHIMVFPRTLPRTLYRRVYAAYMSENKSTDKLSAVEDIHYYMEVAKQRETHTKPSFKKLPSALRRLYKNKIFIGHTINTTLYLFALMGYWNFKPKYLEFQFKRSASEATFYTGVAGLVASVVGLGLSGIVLRTFKPGPRTLSAYSIFLTLFSGFSMLALMMVGCPKIDVQGPMSWSSELGTCNTDCGCSNRYSPVCAADGQTVYYSPCYAGCTTVDETTKPVQYGNCACTRSLEDQDIFAYNSSVPEHSDDKSLGTLDVPLSFGMNTTQGYCLDDCDAFSTYLIITIVAQLIDATGRIGSSILYLRSVAEHDKGLALGLSTTLISLFAFIPAPIVMGAIVDSACIIWDSTCGTRGNCWLYDSDTFRIMIHAIPAVFILLSVIGDIITFRHSKGLQLYDDMEEDLEFEALQSNEMNSSTTGLESAVTVP